MTKYQPLCDYLQTQPARKEKLTLSFDRIEKILGAPLPESAAQHRAWWANEYSPGSHVQAQAWLGADWKVDNVDQDRRWVSFRREKQASSSVQSEPSSTQEATWKYNPLTEFLLAAPPGVIAYTFSFSQVEQILGDRLPESARLDRAWWADEQAPGSHELARGWLQAGWKVDSVHLNSEFVHFKHI
jgi:hypothetical protein